MGGQFGAGASLVNTRIQSTVRRTVGVKRLLRAGTSGVPATLDRAVRSTAGVRGIVLTGAPRVQPRVLQAVRGTARLQGRLGAVQRTPRVLSQRVLAVRLGLLGNILGFATPRVHRLGGRVGAEGEAEQLHPLPVRQRGRFWDLICLAQRVSALLVIGIIFALIIAATFANFHLACGKNIQNIRKLEGRQIAVGHYVSAALAVWFSPGVEAVHQLVLHDAARLVGQLQLHRLAAVVVLAGVGEALLDVHVVHLLVVPGVDQHGQLLANLDCGVNFLRVWIFAHLEVHPTIHRVALELDLLEVEHLHLKRLELHPLLDEVDPLAIDLPGGVPDLLNFFVHLNDDNVAEASLHLCLSDDLVGVRLCDRGATGVDWNVKCKASGGTARLQVSRQGERCSKYRVTVPHSNLMLMINLQLKERERERELTIELFDDDGGYFLQILSLCV